MIMSLYCSHLQVHQGGGRGERFLTLLLFGCKRFRIFWNHDVFDVPFTWYLVYTALHECHLWLYKYISVWCFNLNKAFLVKYMFKKSFKKGLAKVAAITANWKCFDIRQLELPHCRQWQLNSWIKHWRWIVERSWIFKPNLTTDTNAQYCTVYFCDGLFLEECEWGGDVRWLLSCRYWQSNSTYS